jgi:hypothetical protein
MPWRGLPSPGAAFVLAGLAALWSTPAAAAQAVPPGVFHTNTVVVIAGGLVRALAGDVTDPSGAVVPGVAVSRLRGYPNHAVVAEATKTGQDGHFSLPTPAGGGRFTLLVQAAGFSDLVVVNIAVNPKLHRLLHITLSYGQ